MKMILFAVALGMLMSGCKATRGPDAGSVSQGLGAAATAIAVKCATLDDVLVRLTVDSVARAIGNTRRIERLRAERRQVCAEAAARQAGADGEIPPGAAVPAS